MQDRTKNRLWGIGAILVGLAGLGYSGRTLVLAAGQHSWVPAQATVVQSDSTERTKGSGFSSQESWHFAYRYEVEGQSYTANRYSFWSVGGGKSSGVAIFNPGDSITIYHHRRQPELAVVERVQPSFFVWLIAIFALVVAVRGAVIVKTGTAAG